jgi:hypothetical protein
MTERSCLSCGNFESSRGKINKEPCKSCKPVENGTWTGWKGKEKEKNNGQESEMSALLYKPS